MATNTQHRSPSSTLLQQQWGEAQPTAPTQLLVNQAGSRETEQATPCLPSDDLHAVTPKINYVLFFGSFGARCRHSVGADRDIALIYFCDFRQKSCAVPRLVSSLSNQWRAGGALSFWTWICFCISPAVKFVWGQKSNNGFLSMNCSRDHVSRASFYSTRCPFIGRWVQQILTGIPSDNRFILYPSTSSSDDSNHRFSLILALPLQMNQIVGLICNMNHHFVSEYALIFNDIWRAPYKANKTLLLNNKPVSAFTSKTTDTDDKNNMKPTQMCQTASAIVNKFKYY